MKSKLQIVYLLEEKQHILLDKLLAKITLQPPWQLLLTTKIKEFLLMR
jgi:hypothetical protein